MLPSSGSIPNTSDAITAVYSASPGTAHSLPTPPSAFHARYTLSYTPTSHQSSSSHLPIRRTHPEDHIGDHALDFIAVNVDAVQLECRLECRDGDSRRFVTCNPANWCQLTGLLRCASPLKPMPGEYSRLLEKHPQTPLPSPFDGEIHAHPDQPGLCPFQPFVIRPHIARLDSLDERREEELQAGMEG